MKKSAWVLVLFFTESLIANPYTETAREAIDAALLNAQQYENQVQELLDDPENTEIPPLKKGKRCTDCSAKISNVLRPHWKKEESEILIFASFSIPDESLKALSDQARQRGCRLIMRGLYENSFQKTRTKALELGVSFEIDPNLFEAFNIKSVPTFIQGRVEKGRLILKDHDRLVGNVSLNYVLEGFLKEGEINAL